MERTVHFTVLADGGISPFAPQYAGVEGEHNATEVVLDVSAWANENFVYRVEYVDGMGAGDTTGVLTPENNKISLLLPRGWTNAGGQAVVQLVASVLVNGDESQTVYVVDAPIYFDERQSADRDIENVANPMLTELVTETEEAAKNANEAAAELRQAAEDGEFDGEDGKDGKDGTTPHIGENGNWWIGSVDTGKPSRGEPGQNGEASVSIATPEQAGIVKLPPYNKWTDVNLDENSGTAATPRMVFEAYSMIERLFNAHDLNYKKHTTAEEKAAWNAKLDEGDADPAGTAESKVSAHNVDNASHNDIRLLIEGLTTRLNALANSTDEDLDQMAELVAYIKANKALIDQVTTGKVSVTDIVNNLTTNVANKPLSAAQGVALAAQDAALRLLIDALQSGKLDASALTAAINAALAQAKASGEFDGAPGAPGKDATSPTVAIVDIDGGHRITITDVNGTKTVDVMDGAKGDPGKGISSVARTSGTGAAGTTDTYTITYTDKTTSTFTVYNGKDGAKGDDYVLTPADKEEIAALAAIKVKEGGVIGVVDNNKNIVLSGNLTDATYTVKYEMADGSTVNIGNLVVDTRVYYSITSTLTNCKNSNSNTEIAEGSSYSATITANSGYDLKSVTVTMGGTNITSSAVSSGKITIASVTGDIVITAVAEVSGPAYVNQIPISINKDGSLFVGTNGEKGYKANTRISLSTGNETTASGVELTGFIPVKVGDTMYIKGITINASATTQVIAFYNSNFEYSKTGGASQGGVYTGNVFGDVNGEVKSIVLNSANITNNNFNKDVAYIRFSAGEINADSVITINQPIV